METNAPAISDMDGNNAAPDAVVTHELKDDGKDDAEAIEKEQIMDDADIYR